MGPHHGQRYEHRSLVGFPIEYPVPDHPVHRTYLCAPISRRDIDRIMRDDIPVARDDLLFPDDAQDAPVPIHIPPFAEYAGTTAPKQEEDRTVVRYAGGYIWNVELAFIFPDVRRHIVGAVDPRITHRERESGDLSRTLGFELKDQTHSIGTLHIDEHGTVTLSEHAEARVLLPYYDDEESSRHIAVYSDRLVGATCDEAKSRVDALLSWMEQSIENYFRAMQWERHNAGRSSMLRARSAGAGF